LKDKFGIISHGETLPIGFFVCKLIIPKTGACFTFFDKSVDNSFQEIIKAIYPHFCLLITLSFCYFKKWGKSFKYKKIIKQKNSRNNPA